MNSEYEKLVGGEPLRIGMLTPSSNTVLEPLTARMSESLNGRVSVHFSRFRVKEIALDEASNGQFAIEPILDAAALLADAHCDVITWNGTSASWLGFHADTRLCAAIEQRTGVRATSAILSLNTLIQRFGIRRLALVTPYTADVQARIIENYARDGIETVSEAHSGLQDNFAFANVSEIRIEAMIREVARARPDAIVILCTNLRGALVAARLEQELGVPIFDSVAFTLQGCLELLDEPTVALREFGMIFENTKAPIMAPRRAAE